MAVQQSWMLQSEQRPAQETAADTSQPSATTACLSPHVNLGPMELYTSLPHLGRGVGRPQCSVTQMVTWFLQLRYSHRCQRHGYTSASNCQPSR